jgi:hypothetical protein
LGGDEDGGALVKPANQVEEQLAAGMGEWQITQFVEHDEGEPRQVIADAGFALQPIDEVDDGVKAAARTAADTCPRNGYGEMAFAGAGPADQHGVCAARRERPRLPGRGPMPR